ncbi:hypothetical protein EI94DRAFT_1773899 [Lactarius quietus]|nr:hypothetical protein EI94DRAFT_1773899 [Lactarius quietus]
MAGIIHSKAKLSENEQYALKISSQSEANIYTPFASALEWEVARWAKIRGPTSTSFSELMVIEGIDEHLGLSFKNAWELNQMINTHLPGQPPFQQREILVGNGVCKVYFQDILQCIHTLFGNPDFEPHLIFAPEEHYANEDKTERKYHNMHTGSWWWKMQAAVEKDTPRATIVPTSSHAYLLLGYLPMTKLEQEMNKAKRKQLMANLYHACIAGKDGEFMSTAASDVHQTHPILASFIGNYPEQVLTTCTLTGDCPRCGTTNDNLVPHPFWLDLPHTNIYQLITPDILHQLYQGIVKLLKMWILSTCDPAKINAQCCKGSLAFGLRVQCCQLPPNHHIHLFMKGISSLSHYPIHTNTTLQLLMESLTCFHANNRIFINLSICSHFNLPKLHFMSHYQGDFNTQYTERLHINLVKDAYTAMNHKDEGEQMTIWLDRHEHILRHEQYIKWRLIGAWVALRRFISCAKDQSQSCQQLEHSLWQQHLPFTQLPVWHVLKFTCIDPVLEHAKYNKLKWFILGHFNTALINDGYNVGHVCMIFSIPTRYHHLVFGHGVTVPHHLAYKDLDGHWVSSIVPVVNIQCSVHLLPKFGPVVLAEWTSSNILDCCETFFMNTFTDQQMFHSTTMT